MIDWYTIPVFLLMITGLVAAHEYGHFLFARMCGMEVEEFAIGLGKPVFCYMRRKGTDYTLRPLPFGGFVRIKGMTPQEDGGETKIENGFYNKSPGKRLAVLFAGPLFSVLAGMLLLVGLFTTVGERTKKPYLGDMKVGYPAYAAGLRPGDLVLAVDGKPVSTWFQMQALVRSHIGIPVNIEVERGKAAVLLKVTPKKSDEPQELVDAEGNPLNKTAYVGMIGVAGADMFERVPVATAVSDAWSAPVMMVEGLASIFKKPSNFKDMMGGPGTIAAATNDATKQGPYAVIILAGMLSISLGIMNLLPIFPLDGGQIAIAFAELLRNGRRLSLQIQQAVYTVGFALVGTLIVAVLWVDFQHLFVEKAGASPPVHSQPVQSTK